MRRKGRKVPTVQPGQRRQYAPGQLRNSLDPAVRQKMEQLAVAGYEQEGRGLLVVQINEQEQTGIASAEYCPVMELAEMSRMVPFGQAQPANQEVKRYNPEREFVALVLNI